jgi:hypothetical protein
MTITLTREEAQQVLDALEKISMGGHPDWANDVTPILRARLAQPEPTGKYSDIVSDGGLDPRNKFDTVPPQSEWKYNPMTGEPLIDGWPLYSGLPQREWQGLTDEERTYLAWESNNGPHCVAMTEAKLKEKNGG